MPEPYHVRAVPEPPKGPPRRLAAAPSLAQVCLPRALPSERMTMANFWVGGHSMKNGLHFDNYDNLSSSSRCHTLTLAPAPHLNLLPLKNGLRPPSRLHPPYHLPQTGTHHLSAFIPFPLRASNY